MAVFWPLFIRENLKLRDSLTFKAPTSNDRSNKSAFQFERRKEMSNLIENLIEKQSKGLKANLSKLYQPSNLEGPNHLIVFDKTH